jgi:hypothetical protein
MVRGAVMIIMGQSAVQNGPLPWFIASDKQELSQWPKTLGISTS